MMTRSFVRFRRILPAFAVAFAGAALVFTAHADSKADPGPEQREQPGEQCDGVVKYEFLAEGEQDWLQADAPLDSPTPWGMTSDGLACRLIVNETYCDAEPIHAIVEVRNVSKGNITLPTVFDFDAKEIVALRVTGPRGETVKTRQYETWDKQNFGPGRYATLEPGELKRAHFPDIRRHLEGELAAHGDYHLTYVYYGAKSLTGVPAKEENARAWKGTLESNTATITRRPLAKEDLAVHEWGVFSVTSGLSHLNAGRKKEWEALPEFFYRQFPTWRLRWIPSAWNKPVIYFHTTRPELDVDVKVDFPEGAPVVWWPACSSPIDDTPGRRPAPTRTGPLFRSLTWSVRLGQWFPFTAGTRPLGGHRRTSLYEVPADHWLRRAREVDDAATVSTYGTNLTGGAPWIATQVESEKFIYYDGLVPTPDHLRCVRSTAKRTVLKNAAEFPLQNLFVVRRGEAEEAVQFARIAELPRGEEVQVEFKPVAKEAWPGRGNEAVKVALVEAGLSPSEADSLVDIWSERFFQSEGLTAFYILPRSEYDRMLPLTVSPAPAPSEVVRVGVALYSNLGDEPSLRRLAQRLIADLDNDDFGKREQASRKLTEIGPVAFRLLRETIESSERPEVKARCQAILREFDARVYLESAAKESGVKPAR